MPIDPRPRIPRLTGTLRVFRLARLATSRGGGQGDGRDLPTLAGELLEGRGRGGRDLREKDPFRAGLSDLLWKGWRGADHSARRKQQTKAAASDCGCMRTLVGLS